MLRHLIVFPHNKLWFSSGLLVLAIPCGFGLVYINDIKFALTFLFADDAKCHRYVLFFIFSWIIKENLLLNLCKCEYQQLLITTCYSNKIVKDCTKDRYILIEHLPMHCVQVEYCL